VPVAFSILSMNSNFDIWFGLVFITAVFAFRCVPAGFMCALFLSFLHLCRFSDDAAVCQVAVCLVSFLVISASRVGLCLSCRLFCLVQPGGRWMAGRDGRRSYSAGRCEAGRAGCSGGAQLGYEPPRQLLHHHSSWSTQAAST
jgi:hypothetical protein